MKHCRFEDIGMGVYTNYSGSSNFYIADNWFIGRNDPDHVIGWTGDFWAQFARPGSGQKFPPQMLSYIAVKVYGPGHVIAYNYVANFHDGIDIETYGNPDGSSAADGPKYPPQGVLGPPAGGDRFLQQLHDQLPRQPVRNRRRDAQYPGDAEHDDQFRSHAFCNQPSNGGPGLLDTQHCVSSAGRVHQADQRFGWRAVLQQHDLVGDAGGGNVEYSLAK